MKIKIKTKFNIGDKVRYVYNDSDPIWTITKIKWDNEDGLVYEVRAPGAWCGGIQEEALVSA